MYSKPLTGPGTETVDCQYAPRMARSASQYDKAKLALDQAPWRRYEGHEGWDAYWFSSKRELELFFEPTYRPPPALVLHDTDARLVTLDLQPREGDVSSSARAPLEIHLGPSVETLRIRTGLLEQPYQVTIGDSARADLHIVISAGPGASGSLPVVVVRDVRRPFLELERVDARVSGPDLMVEKIRAKDSIVDIDGRVFSALAAGNTRLVFKHRQVKSLTLLGSARVQFARERDPNVITFSEPAAVPLDVVDLAFEAVESAEPATIEGLSTLVAVNARGVHLRVGPSATLRIKDRGSDLTIFGPGICQIENVVDHVTFVPEAESPMLELSSWAVVQEALGSVRLKRCRHAQLTGDAVQGIRIDSIEVDEDADTEGLILRNFTIPVGLPGLQTIAALTDTAAVAVPLVVSDLPGQPEERATVLDGPERGMDRSNEHMRADYAAAMARLAEKRGAPGSVRTKLAWLEYRMRQATAAGPIERSTLAAYRFIGYGERAGPPFALYAALAVAFSIIGLATTRSPDISVAGVGHALQYLLDWATSPVHVLRLAERGDIPLGRGRWAFAGRIALAVPFITGVLALRNYVKRSSGS